MKVFIVSEKSYEIKQVKDFLERLPYYQHLKEEPLAFYSEENPQQALTRLADDAQKGKLYDLVIASAKMKLLSGLRFARSVTSREGMPSVPVALITDGMTKEFAKEAFAHGVSGFVEVPFTAEGMQESMSMLALAIVAREKKKLSLEIEKMQVQDVLPEVAAAVYRKAATAARRAVLAAPWSKEAWLEVADIYMEGGLWREAVPLIKSSLKVNFDNPDAHHALLACYKKTGQSLEELAALRRMVAASPKSPELLIRTGEELLREANYREAAMFFKKAIMHIKPNDPTRLRARMHVGYGKTLAAEGDAIPDPDKHREASEEFKKAITADPAMVSAYLNLIAAYKKLGMTAEAQALMAAAVKVTPDSADGWLDLFAWYLREGEMQKAKFSLEQALRIDPENQITLVTAGEIYLHDQLHGEAAALFEKALAVNPSDTRIYNYLGITYRRLELSEQAVECFTKAITIDKEDCNLYFNLGRAYQQKNDKVKARQAYEAALRLNADFAEAKMALQSLAPDGGTSHPKAATA